MARNAAKKAWNTNLGLPFETGNPEVHRNYYAKKRL